MSKRSFVFALGVLLLVGGPLQAQNAPQGCSSPESRQFDFWIGEWEVTDSAGRVPMGSSRIVNEEQGCVIHENWTGQGGGTGQSFNFYHRRTGKWEQMWVSSSGSPLHLIGGRDGPAMVLEADIPAPNGQGTVRTQLRWTPEPDGRVRQLWRQSRDGGQTWTVAFDGWYRRRVGRP
jgi:hypothetical protein